MAWQETPSLPLFKLCTTLAPMNEKRLLIVGGPNGCGKSSVYEVLRSRKSALPFLNADLIQGATEGVDTATGQLHAGRIMLDRLRQSISSGEPVAFETTLAGRMWSHIINEAKGEGYEIQLVFVTVDKLETAMNRVRTRVELGGHDIPEQAMRRRWKRCHYNFWNMYLPLVDNWYLFDNSTSGARLVAQRVSTTDIQVFDEKSLTRVKDYARR